MDNAAGKVLAFVRERRLIAPGDRVLLSLSAGKDSMALLHLLAELRSELSAELRIFHLNHMTRGCESDADEEFLAGLASRLGIPLAVQRYDVMREKPSGRSFEDFAREARYRLLLETASALGCGRAATAHTADDAAETVMMRVFEGTGMHGLRGIEPARGIMVRPLLALSSEEVYAYLRGRGAAWRDDSSNSDVAYLRNYVRHNIVPAVKGRFPGYLRALAGLSRAARDNAELIEGLILRHYGALVERRSDGAVVIDLERCADDILLVKHLLSAAFRGLGSHVSAAMLDDIARRLSPGRAHRELFRGRGIRAVMAREKGRAVIRIAPEGQERLPGPWEYRVDLAALPASLPLVEAGITLEFCWVDRRRFLEERGAPDIAHIDPGNSVDDIVVRNRRPGDRAVFGGCGKKLKELFIEQKLDSAAKLSLPLLCFGPSIAAVLGGFTGEAATRVSDGFLVKNGVKKILAIRRAKK